MQTINDPVTPIHPDSLKQPSVAAAHVCTLHLFVQMHERRKKKKKSAPAMGKLITELGLAGAACPWQTCRCRGTAAGGRGGPDPAPTACGAAPHPACPARRQGTARGFGGDGEGCHGQEQQQDYRTFLQALPGTTALHDQELSLQREEIVLNRGSFQDTLCTRVLLVSAFCRKKNSLKYKCSFLLMLSGM